MSTSSDWNEGVCNETTGFLFKHRCNQESKNHCDACNKPICPDHERRLEELLLCVSCNRAESQRRGLKNRPMSGYDDDPYYYGNRYYSGYGYHGYGHHTHFRDRDDTTRHQIDPHDLNAGDAHSLKNENDEDFETDMGES